jgi:hypothetical protein
VTSIRSHTRSMRGGLECDGIVRPRGPPGLASVLPDLLRRRAAAAGARAAEALRAQRRRGAGAVVARFARGVGPDYVLYPPEGAPEVGGRRVRDEAAAAEACRPEALPPPRVSTASRPWFRVSRWSRSRPHTTLVVVSGGFRMFQECSGSAGDGHVAAAPPPTHPRPAGAHASLLHPARGGGTCMKPSRPPSVGGEAAVALNACPARVSHSHPSNQSAAGLRRQIGLAGCRSPKTTLKSIFLTFFIRAPTTC